MLASTADMIISRLMLKKRSLGMRYILLAFSILPYPAFRVDLSAATSFWQ